MHLHHVRIEGRKDTLLPPGDLVDSLIHSFGGPEGPTFIVLTGANDQYVQAAGSAGRYILESRDNYGEGFQHLRAGRPGPLSGEKAAVHYRWRCTKGIHPPLGCPLGVDAHCVLDLEAVKAALAHYARTGKRHAAIAWHDVTAEHEDHSALEDDIRMIRPRHSRTGASDTTGYLGP